MTWAKLLLVIGTIESGLDPNAIGDNGKAYGQYQLWEIYIDDVNRTQKTYYSHQDAFNVYHAEQIVKLYTTYWCNRRNLPLTAENLLRFHNGGSNWIHKPHKTDPYIKKCKKLLNSMGYNLDDFVMDI
jgi:hypothetical protein